MKNQFKVTMYKNCFATKSLGEIDLIDWLRNRNELLCKIVDQIRSESDPDIIRRLKTKLPVITPGGLFSERTDKGLIKGSGLLCADIDGKDNPEMDVEEMKSKVTSLPCVMYCAKSVSGKGLYALIKISSSEDHSRHFNAIQKMFHEIGITIDSSCSNLSRLRYYSYDDEEYFNWDSETFSKCLDSKVKVNSTLRPKSRHSNKNEVLVVHQERKERSIIDQMMSPLGSNRFIIVVTSDYSPQANETYNQLCDPIGAEVDITKRWLDWFIICNRIVADFGEEGRDLFHDVCQFYPNYTEEECDALYSSCLVKLYTYPRTQFYEILEAHGF